MRRSSICERTGLRRGTWTPEEDSLLIAYIKRYGHWNWQEIPKYAGLSRCGKSCRLRWMNYLRPNIKRGNYTREEEELIINLHAELGNRWSAIAACLPGRTDNEIKNHWHTSLRKLTKRTSIVKETIPIPMPNVEHEALGRESAVPNGDHPHDIAPLAVPNGDHPHDITPLILESSPVLPLSPPKSSDFSSSSTYDFEEFISENHQVAITDDSEISSDGLIEYDGNFWTEPFLVEDSYNVNDTMPVFVNEYSASLLAEALYPYDLCNGYDMDMLFDLI